MCVTFAPFAAAYNLYKTNLMLLHAVLFAPCLLLWRRVRGVRLSTDHRHRSVRVALPYALRRAHGREASTDQQVFRAVHGQFSSTKDSAR